MNPFRILFLLFLIVPVVEIYVLIQVGSIIGALATALLVVLTAVIGVSMLRQQGFSTVMQAQQSMARGEVPALQLIEGAVLLVCGALLLTPGFVTDGIGFLGLVPFTRRKMILWVLSRSDVIMRGGVHTSHGRGHTNYEEHEDGVTIDAEYERKEERRIRGK